MSLESVADGLPLCKMRRCRLCFLK